jgi:hypothetical protein
MKTILLLALWLFTIATLSFELNEPLVNSIIASFWGVMSIGTTFLLYFHCESNETKKQEVE